ncbi:unnamed protein product [Effrenium voratum]|uniref:Uncharacterized protein n=1 Tax=Effrenium voratum TaxID=2562239 RepID=A0AA36JC04_9DINO|nr:unnamed protein product [Effrenium voratum]
MVTPPRRNLNVSEAYCDSVGCNVPRLVATVRLSLLRMGWSSSARGVSAAPLAPTWLGRRLQRRKWRCNPAAEELFIDRDLLSEEMLTQAAEPLRRITYNTWDRGEEETIFSSDHQVFGSYGSLWTLLAMANGRRWQMDPDTAELLRWVQLLAEVDQWLKMSPDRRSRELQPLLWEAKPGTAARRWALQQLGAAFQDVAERTAERPCLEALRRLNLPPAEAMTSPAWPSQRPPECQGASPAVLASWLGSDLRAAKCRDAGRHWRLCGAPGAVWQHRLGRISATVLGAWARDQAPEDCGWEVELSLFMAPIDDCVLVDGNRLFQTHPQSYLTSWRCHLGGHLAVGGVVSYSGTVALVRCRFPTAPAGKAELAIESSVPSLRAAGWSLTGIKLCPFEPLLPVPRFNEPASSYARKLTVCSEVLYGLSGPYKSLMVKHWLEYHRLLGVDHFVLYDRDGSLQGDGILDPYILNGYVTYFPRFSLYALSEHHDLIHAGDGWPSAAAPDAQAASHCLFMQRGLSEWVSFLHSPDEYLSNSQGLRHVESILGPLRPKRAQGLAAVDVTAIYFTRSQHRKPQGPVRKSPWLFGRYVYRASEPLHLKDWGSPVAGFLNRFGSPLVNPERVGDLVSAHYPRPSAGSLYLDDVPMDFVRANHYGEAFHVRQIIEEHDTPVKDESILWAEEAMASLGLAPLPPGPEPT